MARRRQIYEGKAKILYEGPEPGTLIQYFKDDATAFNAQKRGTISGKGVLNNRISEHIFVALQTIGVPTHFIRRLNMREQLIRQVEIVPIEVVVRNVAAGSLTKRFELPRAVSPAPSISQRRRRSKLGNAWRGFVKAPVTFAFSNVTNGTATLQGDGYTGPETVREVLAEIKRMFKPTDEQIANIMAPEVPDADSD